jgi:hypothetical protein
MVRVDDAGPHPLAAGSATRANGRSCFPHPRQVLLETALGVRTNFRFYQACRSKVHKDRPWPRAQMPVIVIITHAREKINKTARWIVPDRPAFRHPGPVQDLSRSFSNSSRKSGQITLLFL